MGGDATARRLALFLPDRKNPYMVQMAKDAQERGRSQGFLLQVEYAEDNDFTAQVRQISAAIAAPPAERPLALLVMGIHESVLKGLSERALAHGLGWMFLNRSAGNVDALRRAHPGLPVGFVTPDQRASGELQARQLLKHVPQGGPVVYIQGRATNTSAEVRRAALTETLAGSPVKLAEVLDGNWTRDDTARELERWLRRKVPAGLSLAAVACQSDIMAEGARTAIEAVAAALQRPELRLVPVFGCDGLDEVGKRMVDAGHLKATIVFPVTAGPAIDLLAAWYRDGTAFPAEVVLAPRPYPA
jgi:ABC-type sugar transport system substrate-binding protein